MREILTNEEKAKIIGAHTFGGGWDYDVDGLVDATEAAVIEKLRERLVRENIGTVIMSFFEEEK